MVVRSVAFMYKWTPEYILNNLSQKDLFEYYKEGHYMQMDSLGISYKKPLSEEDKQNRKEREAQLKAIYYKNKK